MSTLPKAWIEIELSEIANIIRGVTYKKEHSTNIAQDGFLPVIRATNITGSALHLDELVYVPAENISNEQILQPGDIVIASSSGSKEIVGKAGAFSDGNFVGSFGAFCTGIRPSIFLSADYFGYYFQTPSYRKSVSELSAGSNINNLKTRDLASQRFPLPPFAEQNRIVTKLEELLTDLDAGVAELMTAQKKLTQYRQSLLKAAVEGALTAQWRENNPATESGAQLLERILLERRARWEAKQLAKFAEQGKTPPKGWQKKYPEPVQPDTTDLPQLPEGWVWASVQLLGDVQLGRQRSPEKMKGISPTPYIRAANITEAGIDLDDVLEMDFSEQERNVFQLQAGDVLLTEASGSAEHVGRPAIWPNIDGLYCFQNTVLRFKPQCVSSEFAFYSFLAMQKLGVFSKLSGGVGINHLSAGKFSKLPLALPASSEQAVIVKTLKSQLAGVEEQHLAIALALNQSVAQRQNILRAAFSGQLVPQDLNDEPASVLLERIRAQRMEQAKQPKPRKTKKKESSTVARKLADVLTEAGDWLPAQEAFRRCGIADGAQTEKIEALYAELRELDKNKQLLVDVVTDENGRKVTDRLKWVG
ncbi:restriction endonuclease subunit S [Dickeya ananatis]|uniref:restriction endonuclease subunit S n=1 Tax=Dickeya ananatis TaxID=3061286 RepID=UPI001CE6A926|nr:restriction endonuclease subunit S [Dickeya zeae]